jgi:type VI secretion system secreted protein VgrG
MPAGDLTGTLTLTGSATDVWVFQMTGSTLTTANASQVVMAGGASACNVYWQVSSSATLGSASSFAGSIFSGISITVGTTADVIGRVIAGVGAVTMDGTNTIGGCSAPAVPTLPQWALLCLVVGLLGLGYLRLRRRSAGAMPTA